MERSPLLENQKDSFERAVNDLHNKIFSNYKRWVRHVNVQHVLTEPEGSVTAESSSFGNLSGAPLLPLTAVSGDAWQSIGMWRFVSNEDEREWTCNAQLHQLVLWYLIWGEAANLRHVPELLCFIFYCACNALQLSTRSSWEVATFVEAVDDDGPYGKEDFLNSIVSPIYEFLKLEVLTRKEDLVCERVMYDDVNETFWSVEGVHAMLPNGCAQVECPEATSEPGAPRRAYAHLRNLLTKSEGNVSSLNVYFRKTYREVPGWPHLYQVFSRVFIFHAVLLHLTIAVSFEGFNMEYLFTAVITHALLKALRTIIFMYLVWPLKKAQQDAARTKIQQRSEQNRRASARQLHAFIAVGSSRILGYLLVPLVYIVETMARRRWSRECLAPAAWCDKHVINGIADAYSPACRGADGLDYLLEFCKDCLSNEKEVSATCGLLTFFAYECTAICTSEAASRNDVFLVVAAVYTVIFLGSEILLTRPGSVSNFHWARHGYMQKKNKATGWADVISGFSETSFQYHACLCNDAQPNPLLFENENLKLLSGPEMEPACIPEAAGALSIEARSAHWQRWGRVWNEIIHNMRERDYLSNSERDELIFFALREPEHVAVFGTPEYLVFPTMLTAPVFDTHPWNRGHFTRYQHTVRTMLQTRDLFAWLLITLGVVEKRELGPLLNALTSVSSRAGESLRSPTSEQVARLTELRKAVVAFLVILSQLPSNSDNGSAQSEGFVEPLLSPESRDVNSSSGSNSSEMARELELQLTIVLDAVKMLISQDTTAANFSASSSPDDGRAVKTDVAAYKQLRKLISLESLRDENKWQQAVATSQLKAFGQIVDALHRSFSTPSPGSTPASDEVHRQVLFFVNSFRDRAIGTAAPVRKMKTMTTLIPYFKEDVSYSEQSLKTMDDEGVNLENLLQALFATEWQNMCERVRHRGDESDPVPYQILKEWASDRGQVLSRSVRGVMLYADALRIQARLERVPEDEVEAVISSKFEFVVSCQCYGQLRDSPRADERWKADCIDELRHAFPANLKIAFVEETDGLYYSVLLGVDPDTQEEITLSKVRLPGTPIIGEGKPENQNHAIIFTKGEYLQTLDMNQDNYIGEALKLRNLLEGFKGSIRLTGFREYIFSERGGAVAAFAATSEFVFGTSLQRFLAHPLCVRFHYGHPDVWDKQWALTNGGVSKASRTLHLSEDIFAGFNCSMRGGSIAYVEFIHVGKGRDMGFVAVNAFDQKISTGNALQCTSRELYRLGKGFDFPRLLSFYFTACGYFVTNRLTTNVLYFIILCWLFVALLQAEKLQVVQTASGEVILAPEWNTPGPAGAGGRVLADNSPSGDSFFHNSTIGFLGELEQRLAQIRSSWSDTSSPSAVEIATQTSVSTYEESWGIFQLGFFAMLPYFFELWLERGFLFSVHHNVFLLACLSWVFFLFTSQTKGYYFSSALTTGKADYVSTGRGFVVEPGSFISLYSIFAKSHFHDGVEAFIYATVFQAATTLGGYDTWTIRIYVGSLLLAPLLFNPQECFSQCL
ncbi:hypothetical protein AB1Y20_013419 [Prymnesium parvum]|uniref:1,3-beta-glucan synthase n=1 Tax=Prymnesium parvum TaxID=97485 RepID=A0AB34II74_PRYPA